MVMKFQQLIQAMESWSWERLQMNACLIQETSTNSLHKQRRQECK